MADLLSQGVEVIRTAETSLRALMQAGVSDGQYEGVALLAQWAEQLARMSGNGSANGRVADGVKLAQRSATSTVANRRNRSKPNRRKSKYPIFKRSGDNLIKIAWSKSSKSEYQHQAPNAVVLALLQKMEEASDCETLITMDDVLPLLIEDKGEVPAYRSYACLAWLRSIGVVEQHGRRGYSVPPAQAARSLVERAWTELPIYR